MSRDPAPPPSTVSLSTRPWPPLLAALLAIVGGWLLAAVAPTSLIAVRLALVFAGTVLIAVALTRQARRARWDWSGRVESAALVSVAGVASIAAYKSMAADWDAGHMFYAAAFLTALVGSLLLLLSSRGRRVAISLLVVFHFTGMAVTITSIDPPGATGPWVSKQLWTWVYRPYLSFLYLTNAYHFYSPNPGPPSLLWFAVTYPDGGYRWVKLPDRRNSPIGMHYQRHLALPEHSFSLTPMPILPTPLRGSWQMIYHRRELGSTLEYLPEGRPIPMVQDLDITQQYREPTDVAKRLTGSLARRVFWTEQEKDPANRIKSVKIYRVTHQILTPAELAAGVSPYAKEKHLPYYMGEYDGEGNLLDPLDPFLYWLVPIAVVPASFPNHGLATRPGVPAIRLSDAPPPDGVLLDGLEMHAAGRMSGKRTEEKK
ncbi:MAG: hypothetical protein U0736_16880 [Gemmataceae bacterium]